MEFLYPTSRQFPFDQVCSDIVAALEERNFDVPGVRVEFHAYGSGEQKMRRVSTVDGRDFHLWFCRIQRRMPGGQYNDTAAVTQLAIPRKKISVYEDSGPTLDVYVGDDWETDRERFLRLTGLDSRRLGEPRTYLRYKDRRRSSRLLVDDDLGREYGTGPGDPETLDTRAVLEEFRAYLADVVLPSITAHPVPPERVDVLTPPPPVPFPASIGPLFCFGDYADARRIRQGKADPAELAPYDRYGMPEQAGYRLAPLGTRNDGTVPAVAFDGFLWCGIGAAATRVPAHRMTGLERDPIRVDADALEVPVPVESLEIPGHHRWGEHRFVVRVTPRTANEIYVADHAPWETRRVELWAGIQAEAQAREAAPPDSFTGAEIDDFTRARARTIVPITEYAGGFARPVVLIRRELDLGEVSILTGPQD
jgi:hypothetical protein